MVPECYLLIEKDKELLLKVRETEREKQSCLVKETISNLVCINLACFCVFPLFHTMFDYPIRFSGVFYHFTMAKTGYKMRL